MWYLSFAAEALLLWTLGARSAWGRYLAFDLARGAALSQIPVAQGWNAIIWIATEPVALVLQYLAVAPVLSHGARSPGDFARWMLYVAGVIGVAIGLFIAQGDAGGFMLKHHAMIVARRAAVLVLFLALLLSEAIARHAALPPSPESRWLLGYYLIQVISIAAMGAMGPEWIRPLNTAHAVCITLLFAAWGTHRARIPGTARPR